MEDSEAAFSGIGEDMAAEWRWPIPPLFMRSKGFGLRFRGEDREVPVVFWQIWSLVGKGEWDIPFAEPLVGSMAI